MRYNKRIMFVQVVAGGTYNPTLGENDAEDQVYTTLPCSTTSFSRDKEYQIYGTREGDVQIVRLQHEYEQPFDHALIDGVRYKEIKNQELSTKSVYHMKRADF